MEDKLTGNSYKSRMEEQNKEPKKIEKVVTGNVKRKKSGKLLSSIFISEDAGKVKSYVLLDVLVPALKKAVYDVITSGIEIILYGETRNRNKSNASKVSYASYYSDPPHQRTRDRSISSSYNHDDIIIEDRKDAEEVLDRLDEMIERYGMASVADFYELVGVTGNYTDNKYGWKDLRSAEVIRAYGGYIIKFPPAVPLN